MGERVTVITGATGKLGSVVARAFAEAGDRLALVGRSPERLQALVAALPGGADRHLAVAADLGTEEGARAAAAVVGERLGRPMVLLHFIGGWAGGSTVGKVDEAAARALFELNTWTAFHAIRAFLPDISAAAGGRIVTISTPLAGAPSPGIGAYVASKAALESLTLTVAAELAAGGKDATANVILVRTIGEAKPTHTPAERIAVELLGLCSPEAAGTNGQRILLIGPG